MKPRYHVYLRGKGLQKATNETLSRAAGLARADANRILRSKIPLAVAVCASPKEARAQIRKLRTAGLDGFAVSTQALRAWRPFPVFAVKRTGEGLFWRTKKKGDHWTLVSGGSVRMIVLGKIHTKWQKETRREAHTSGGHFGHGHIRVRVLGSERTHTSYDEDAFCCLFLNAEVAYMFRDSGFDFRESLGKPPPTRRGSFQKIVQTARSAYPHAVLDDSLHRRPGTARMFGSSVSCLGDVGTTVTVSRKKGSTADRMMRLAYLKYLQASGGR
ncbi:MAG: hypothetical protein ACYTAF_06190 [Planctomycetota bacterium]|jgi:hypothetical protein